jgi:hypothetical protein
VVERIGERVPSVWDLGLNLRWDKGGAVDAPGPYASLHVSNLLDAEHRYPASELIDLERGMIGAGRTIAATVGYSF